MIEEKVESVETGLKLYTVDSPSEIESLRDSWNNLVENTVEGKGKE